MGWGNLYDEPRLGLRLSTLEFPMTIETVGKNRKSFVKFHLFGKSFRCDFSCFSELLDFSKSCLPESNAMRNFSKVEFSDAISRKSTTLRFSDIHSPSLRFLHRWMSFTLFPTVELHYVATPDLKCLFAMVNSIKCTPVADILNYFINVHKMLGPIECTSMVTRIAMNLGCSEMANLAYIEGDVPILGLDHFVHAHILREELDHSLSMLYGRKVIRLPNPGLRLYSCESLTLQFDQMERRAMASQDHLALMGELIWKQHSRLRLPQAHPQEAQWDTWYGGGYSGHHEGGCYYPSHGYPEPSL
jgi:hypothetical protein